jgi:glucose-1-phosphate cytidylyltransferase
MKTVILAGGLGTRISEETHLKPKPMIEIGGRPLLWHIMKIYSAHGLNDFIICCGYKGYLIKEYFANYFLHMSDVTFNISNNSMQVHQQNAEPWKVTLVDTGETTSTGGRLKRVGSYLKGESSFCFTYGDGLSNLNITDEIKFHHQHKRLVTVAAVIPPARYGAIDMQDSGQINKFVEKPQGEGGWISGGFFVVSTAALDSIAGDDSSWEADTLVGLSDAGQVMGFRHKGFWQPMDTLREKIILDEMWVNQNAPWKIWK